MNFPVLRALNIIGDLDQLRGARIIGLRIEKEDVYTPKPRLPGVPVIAGTEEVFVVRFIPFRCRKPRVLRFDGNDVIVRDEDIESPIRRFKVY